MLDSVYLAVEYVYVMYSYIGITCDISIASVQIPAAVNLHLQHFFPSSREDGSLAVDANRLAAAQGSRARIITA